jgi:hypothetical protein
MSPEVSMDVPYGVCVIIITEVINPT